MQRELILKTAKALTEMTTGAKAMFEDQRHEELKLMRLGTDEVGFGGLAERGSVFFFFFPTVLIFKVFGLVKQSNGYF